MTYCSFVATQQPSKYGTFLPGNNHIVHTIYTSRDVSALKIQGSGVIFMPLKQRWLWKSYIEIKFKSKQLKKYRTTYDEMVISG